MSLETRSNSAQFKRAEQLRRWEDSDTNREPISPKHNARKIKFTSGCVFLAACAAGDKDEVLKLLEKGADINTANVDGLTALHQACIDDNFDMVEFLVEHGADVNRGDNEGWTPLHATASCGFLYIAKYLIEQNANVAAVNNDGELAIDIADDVKMKDLLNSEIKQRGIDCEAARNEEQNLMLRDANEWLNGKSGTVDIQNPKNRATALHVAAAKGYTDVTKVLLECGADVDRQDIDGWTPLHAAAHWGQEVVCEILVEHLADMDAKNFVGQTPFDLADSEMYNLLESLKAKQNKEEVLNRRQAKKRIDDVQDQTTVTPSKVKKVEVEVEKDEDNSKVKHDNNIEMEVSSESESETESSSDTDSNSTDDEKKNRVNAIESNTISNKNTDVVRLPPNVPPQLETNNDDILHSWRKQQNAKQTKAELPSPVKAIPERSSADVNIDSEVILRRSNSEKLISVKKEAHAYNRPSSAILDFSSSSPKIPTYKKPYFSLSHYQREEKPDNNVNSSQTSPVKSSPPSPVPNSQPPRRSFVPPVRDEESETQRKAHAKRVRETRRSTQGVTLEEIKSAEQLVKKKNQPNNNNNNNNEQSGDSSNGVSVTATITTAAPTVITRESAAAAAAEEVAAVSHERRPSWRLRIDSSNKFKLEDATKPSLAEQPSTTTPSFIRRNTTTTTTTTSPTSPNPVRPSSAPVEAAEATVTLPRPRPKSVDEREQDKENDVRNAQGTLATQAAIQRRKRPKRRSTGVVNFENMDDLEQEKEQTGGGGDYQENVTLNHQEVSIYFGLFCILFVLIFHAYLCISFSS